MPDLLHSLLKQDIGHLRIVAELWGIELKSNDEDSARDELSASLLDPELAAELMASLMPEAKIALAALTNAAGRIPWATFVREFGDIREMGAGKRDRERPHLKPASSAEVLFYRALLARAFFDTEKGPQEFAYIPNDLLELIHHGEHRAHGEKNKKDSMLSVNSVVKSESLGRGATPGEKNHIMPADDHILDDATTILAALRLGKSDWQSDLQHDAKLLSLLHTAGLLKKNIPQAEAVRKFLEASRADALQMLVEAWQSSETFNELRLLPGLICEGEWKNQPLVTREFLLNLLEAIPDHKWWSLTPFVRDIQQKFPDFQRPAGDYDSWFIKRESDGQYLRGFAYWDEVDGALIRFFVTAVLHWLGMAELASAQPDGEITAFRISGIGNWESQNDSQLPTRDYRISNIENAKLKVASNGKITAPRFVPRVVRYQLSRFCEWDDERPQEYKYRITPHSLTKAKEQGLKVEHLLALLSKHSDAGIPPALVKALQRWEVNGTEARAETQVILKVSRPEVLEELRKSKAARFLGEPLGPTTVTVKSGAIQKVMEALTELGLLAEDNTAQAAVLGGDTELAPRTAQRAKEK